VSTQIHYQHLLSPIDNPENWRYDLFEYVWLCVGVKNADENELKAIASEPEDTHVYNVADFSVMSTIVDGLTRKVCDGVEQQDKEINRECFTCCLNFHF